MRKWKIEYLQLVYLLEQVIFMFLAVRFPEGSVEYPETQGGSQFRASARWCRCFLVMLGNYRQQQAPTVMEIHDPESRQAMVVNVQLTAADCS